MIIERTMDASEWNSYVETAAAVQGYTLDGPQHERVAAQMALMAQVAQPLLGLQLAVETEPAAQFRPLMHE